MNSYAPKNSRRRGALRANQDAKPRGVEPDGEVRPPLELRLVVREEVEGRAVDADGLVP